MPRSTLLNIVWNACQHSYRHHLTTIAAGVAFFVLLAVFPGIAATVALYGLFADPERGGALLTALPSVLPEPAVAIITRQIRNIAEQRGDSEQPFIFVPLLGFAILLWSTAKGMRSLFGALNVIHDADERRGFIKLTTISLLFTVGFIAFLLSVVSVVFVLPPVFERIGFDEVWSSTLMLLRWPALLIVVGFSVALIYHFGSNRENATWRWITWGSGVASLLWVCVSMLFEWTVARFGGFEELYGSLSSVIGFMIWIWLSSIVMLFGAELDAAIRRCTAAASRSAPSSDAAVQGPSCTNSAAVEELAWSEAV